MKKSRIVALFVLSVAVIALFTGGFGSKGIMNRLALAGYGGKSHEDARDADKDGPKITHTVVTKAHIGQPIEILAKVKDSKTGVEKVTLNWRLAGQEWNRDRMFRIGRTYTFMIPAQTRTGQIEYYIKAEDEKGNVRNHGRGDNPHVISI